MISYWKLALAIAVGTAGAKLLLVTLISLLQFLVLGS